MDQSVTTTEADWDTDEDWRLWARTANETIRSLERTLFHMGDMIAELDLRTAGLSLARSGSHHDHMGIIIECVL